MIDPWAYAGATQTRTFTRCGSKWFFEQIEGHKVETTEPMARGTRVHWLTLDHWLVTGAPPRAGLDFFDERNAETHTTTEADVETALAVIPYLPSPPLPRAHVEHAFDTVDLAPGVRFKGSIDLLEGVIALPDGRRALLVSDLKTRSDLKWALDPFALRNDTQAIFYCAHVALAVGWLGPVVFRHYNVTTSGTRRVEVIECVFEPDDLARGLATLRPAVYSMALFAHASSAEALPYNLEACGDYASRVNPDGCPHRQRCAALGRRTQGAWSFLHSPETESLLMSIDPLAALLAGASAPSPPDPLAASAAAGAPDPARQALLAQILAIDPSAIVADDADLGAVYTATTAVQTGLITQLLTLQPTTYSADGRELRAVSVPKLRQLVQDAQPVDPAAMTDAAVVAAIVRERHGVTAEHCAAYPPDQLRAMLIKMRAEATTNAGQVAPPDAAPTTVAPTVAADVAASAPKTPAKRTARGAKLPEAYGGELCTRTPLDTGQLQRYLTDKGMPVPVGKGYGRRLRTLCAQVVAGIVETVADVPDDAGPFAAETVATPVAPQTAPHSDRVHAEPRVRALATRLGLPVDETVLAAQTPAQLVDTIAALEVRLSAAEAAGAGVTPPTPHVVPEPLPVAPAPEPPPVAPQGNDFVLYVDCRPTREPVTDILGHEVVAQLGARIAEARGLPHYLSIPHAEGSKLLASTLAAQVARNEPALVGSVYVSSRGASGPHVIEALLPYARDVIRSDG